MLIPYLAADNACYAFQVADYAKHFTCFSLDLRGTGASDKPDGAYSTELFADDVAAFMQAEASPERTSRGSRLARRSRCGSASSIRKGCCRCRCTAAGRRPTRS